MNKKGFTITVILYAMVLLISTIFFLLLGTVKNRYKNQSKLQNNIMTNINIGSDRRAVLPTCNDLVYTGEEQVLASGGKNVYLIDNIGKDVGEYRVKVHAVDYCKFDDNSVEKEIVCSIKAN